MKKIFLGVTCIIYSLIIFLILITNKLNNFIAPNMQKFTLMSLVLLLVIGFVLLISNGKEKFKISDIILLMPLLMLVISNDTTLSTNIAENRTNNYEFELKENDINEEVEDNKIINEQIYDFTKVDFDIVDESYVGLTNYFTEVNTSSKYEGKTVRIRGFIYDNDNIPEGYYVIGKYNITCCAADATFGGLFIKQNNEQLIPGHWYEIEGVLEKSEFTDISLTLKVINYKTIDKNEEEYYVYACYVYDDGSCKELMKYNLD